MRIKTLVRSVCTRHEPASAVRALHRRARWSPRFLGERDDIRAPTDRSWTHERVGRGSGRLQRPFRQPRPDGARGAAPRTSAGPYKPRSSSNAGSLSSRVQRRDLLSRGVAQPSDQPEKAVTAVFAHDSPVYRSATPATRTIQMIRPSTAPIIRPRHMQNKKPKAEAKIPKAHKYAIAASKFISLETLDEHQAAIPHAAGPCRHVRANGPRRGGCCRPSGWADARKGSRRAGHAIPRCERWRRGRQQR